MAKQERVDYVPPSTGAGVEWEVLTRTVTENAHRQYPDIKSDPYDEIVEERVKRSYGNPEEVFPTRETVRYRRYKPVVEYPTEVKVTDSQKVSTTN